jgi:ABC-type antimicrobial peptide transport system permease subunit
MIEQLRFYIRHSFNDMRVNGQRTLFALLCIAAGVAAIVSLQTLGVMIDDTLTGSLQESNKSDIRLSPPEGNGSGQAQRGKDEGVIASGGMFGINVFTLEGVQIIGDWFAEHYPGSTITYMQALGGPAAGMTISNPRNDAEQTFVSPFIVEAEHYPLYGARRAEDGTPLGELIQAPTDIVISRNLADTLDAQVGDTLALAGANERFTLRGIVPTSEEAGFENFAGNLIGYYYLDVSAVPLFNGGLPEGAGEIYVRLGDPAQVESATRALQIRFPYVGSTSTADLEEMNRDISDAINQLVVIMGLVSLLIGGIGIVNTMLVIVSRRTTEVAVLKTIGLKAGQITTLFLAEAVLMGIFGSLIGIALGWIAALAIKGVAESFLAQTLTFRITLIPPLTGFVVGVIVTTIFGFLPTLAAGQVRPNLVLRPSDMVVPRAGRARSFAALLFVMLAISLVAQPLINDLLSEQMIRMAALGVGGFLGLLMGLTMLAGGLFAGWTRRKLWRRMARWALLVPGLPLLGAAFGYAVPALLILFSTFIAVAVLYAVLWLIIWLVGRFLPTWRWVDLKLALRAMLVNKGRAASTLLALVVGVFTLSLITMLATAITNRFEQMLENEVGGNVIIFAAGAGDTLNAVESRLQEMEGVRSYSALGIYNVNLVSATDVSANRVLTFSQLSARARQDGGEHFEAGSLDWMFNSIDARGVESNLPDVQFYQGRQLNAADTGPWDRDAGEYPPIVISANQAIIATGLEVGDQLLFEFVPQGVGRVASGAERQLVRFEIVGMVDRRASGLQVNFGSYSYAPSNAFPPGLRPDTVSAIVDIEETQVRALRRSMNEIPLAFVMETKMLNDLLRRVLDQFTSFPILVAGLALVVGGIVIANSVALATLERRREIAIMKAVGLQRERVLGMLLLEYGLMGLIGGLIGVGLGGIGLLILLVQAFGGDLGRTIPYLTALQLMALCVLIALAAAILTAWRASGEKPLNVLRYE